MEEARQGEVFLLELGAIRLDERAQLVDLVDERIGVTWCVSSLPWIGTAQDGVFSRALRDASVRNAPGDEER